MPEEDARHFLYFVLASLRSPALSMLRSFYSGRPQRLLPAGR